MQKGPLEVRRIRDVGNWGRASEHIGRRWEEVGQGLLESHLAHDKFWDSHGYRPTRYVSLVTEPGVQNELSGLGLPNPDVVLLGLTPLGETVLQALDFKWTLEFASYRQIRAEALLGLLAEDTPHLRQSLTAVAGSLDGQAVWRDGVLFAPDSAVNRRFLFSPENQRQEYPVEPKEVIFQPIDGPTFFGVLPGWDTAQRLAALDRALGVIRTLDGAEKYYRLGAGLQGAIGLLSNSIFAEEVAPIDAEAVWQFLRRNVKVSSSAAYLDYVSRMMSLRQQNNSRLQTLVAAPYRFSDLVNDLAARGISVPERTDRGPIPPERRRWIEIHKQLMSEYRGIVIRAAQKLSGRGKSDAEILTQLEQDGQHLAARAKAIGQRAIEGMLSSEGASNG